jgi:hypothetical protein
MFLFLKKQFVIYFFYVVIVYMVTIWKLHVHCAGPSQQNQKKKKGSQQICFGIFFLKRAELGLHYQFFFIGLFH